MQYLALCRSVSPVPLSYESFVPCKVILIIPCINLNNRNDPNSCRDSHISIQGLEKPPVSKYTKRVVLLC